MKKNENQKEKEELIEEINIENKKIKLKKSKLKRLLKFLKWLFTFKKIIVYVVVFGFLYTSISLYNYIIEKELQKKGRKICQELHNRQLAKFSDITGITADNVIFGNPIVIKAKNLRIFDFKNMKVGNNNGIFTCSYNTITEIPKDVTKKLNEGD